MADPLMSHQIGSTVLLQATVAGLGELMATAGIRRSANVSPEALDFSAGT
jgi:hypothetical protein